MTTSQEDQRFARLTDEEELANAAIHGFACLAACIATAYGLLQWEFDGLPSRLGFLTYGLSSILVFAMSTLSHIEKEPRRLNIFRAWDQGAIYLFIAGTYTPGVIAFSGGWFSRGLLLFVWCVAFFGFYRKVFARHQIHKGTAATYLLLGWVPALCLLTVVPLQFFLWLLAGGICYSIGVIFLLNDRRIRFFHAGWHLAVTVAAAVHGYAICTMAI